MKIGILTFHRSLNNGALIQCYSLYSKIKNDFPDCDVEVIDYDMPIMSKIYPLNIFDYYKYCPTIANFIKKTYYLLKDPFQIKRFRIKRKKFDFALKSIKLSETKIVSDKVEDLFSYINDNYDVVVVGSDAVWNYTLRGFPNPYFLDESINIPMISYAASCYGMNYEKIPDNESVKISNVLSKYVFLGVRDSETENMLKFLGCQKECYHTCDPTLFLNLDSLPVDEIQLKSKLTKKGFDFNKKTIGLMLDENSASQIIDMMGDSYQYVSLFNYSKRANFNLFDLNPFEWAFIFRYFCITFTTYFHGTLLSLKNGTPVITLALNNDFNKNHVSKTEDVLKRLNMEEMYFELSDDSFAKIKVQADKYIGSFDKEKLKADIETEADTYLRFKDALQKIIR